MTPADGHPALESLVWPDASIRAHLTACAECQQRSAALTDEQARVQHWLRSSPAPPPIPPEVAARLRGAIAVEVDRRERADGAVPSGPVQRQVRRTPQVWLAAAGVAAVALLTGVVATQLTGSSDPVISAERAVPESAAQPGNGSLAGADEDAAAPGEVSGDGSSGNAPAESSGQSSGQDVPLLPSDLVATAQRLLDDPAELPAAPADCAGALAAQSGGQVRAAGLLGAPESPQVLVVLRTNDELVAWWLPSCTSGRDEALGAATLPAP